MAYQLHHNEQWLRSMHTSGLSQRDIAKAAGVAPITIRSQFKKFGIVARSISDGVSLKSVEITKKNVASWTSDKRRNFSHKMIDVQSKRKAELSKSAKQNWQDNRAVIVTGIRKSSSRLEYKESQSRRSIVWWSSSQNRRKMSRIMIELWKGPEYRNRVISQTSKAIKALWRSQDYRKKYGKRFIGTGLTVKYKPIKNKQVITFKSRLECGYAILLDLNPLVKSWGYEDTTIQYVDDNGSHTHIIDFTINYSDGRIEYIEVKPENLQSLTMKYSSAQIKLPNWRFIAPDEILKSYDVFNSGIRQTKVEIIVRWPRNHMQHMAWSATRTFIPESGWSIIKTKKFKAWFRHTCIRG